MVGVVGWWWCEGWCARVARGGWVVVVVVGFHSLQCLHVGAFADGSMCLLAGR